MSTDNTREDRDVFGWTHSREAKTIRIGTIPDSKLSYFWYYLAKQFGCNVRREVSLIRSDSHARFISLWRVHKVLWKVCV